MEVLEVKEGEGKMEEMVDKVAMEEKGGKHEV